MQRTTLPPMLEALESRQLLAVDLTASLFFTAGAALSPGNQYQAQVDVSNSGEPMPNIPVRVHLFANPGTTYSPSTARFLSAATLSTSPRWGDVEQVNIPFTIPTNISNGSYSLFAMVDPDRVISEADETNNFSSGVAVTITGASGGGETGPVDLVTSVTLSTMQILPNTPVRASVSITNLGTGAVSTAGTFVQLFWARGSVPDPANDRLLGLRTVPGLAAGATDTGEFEFMFTPEQAVGAIRLYAVADLSNQTPESDETNNFSEMVTGVGIGGVSDLAGAFISGRVPITIVEGQKAPSNSSIKFSVRNAGDYPISKGVSVVMRAYLRPVLDITGDGDLAASDARRFSVGGMASHSQRTVDLKIKTPATLPAGDFWLIVKIDDTNVLAEFSEANNTIDPGMMIRVVPPTVDPGFSAGSMSFKLPTAPAKNGSVSLTLSNLGNSLFKGRVTVQVYYRDVQGNEVIAGTFGKGVSIKAGGASRMNSLRIKSPPAPGEYALAARLVLPEGVADAGPGNNSWEFGAVTVAG